MSTYLESCWWDFSKYAVKSIAVGYSSACSITICMYEAKCWLVWSARSGGNKHAQLCHLFDQPNSTNVSKNCLHINQLNATSISKLSLLFLHHKAANGINNVRSSKDVTRVGNSQEGGKHNGMVYFTMWVPTKTKSTHHNKFQSNWTLQSNWKVQRSYMELQLF